MSLITSLKFSVIIPSKSLVRAWQLNIVFKDFITYLYTLLLSIYLTSAHTSSLLLLFLLTSLNIQQLLIYWAPSIGALPIVNFGEAKYHKWAIILSCYTLASLCNNTFMLLNMKALSVSMGLLHLLSLCHCTSLSLPCEALRNWHTCESRQTILFVRSGPLQKRHALLSLHPDVLCS